MKEKEFSVEQLREMLDRLEADEKRRRAKKSLHTLLFLCATLIILLCRNAYAAEERGQLTIFVRVNTVAVDELRVYSHCSTLGEYQSQDMRAPAGYAYWTCESWEGAGPNAETRLYKNLRYGLNMVIDGDAYENCVQIESGWNIHGRYGFRTYDCR